MTGERLLGVEQTVFITSEQQQERMTEETRLQSEERSVSVMEETRRTLFALAVLVACMIWLFAARSLRLATTSRDK